MNADIWTNILLGYVNKEMAINKAMLESDKQMNKNIINTLTSGELLGGNELAVIPKKQVTASTGLLPFQTKLLDITNHDPDNKHMAMLVGGPGVGKSYIATYYAIREMRHNKSHVLFISPNFTMIDHTRNQFRNHLSPTEVKTDGNQETIRLKNGSAISFVSGENINSKVSGLRANIIIFDDFHQMCEENPTGVDLALFSGQPDFVLMTSRPFGYDETKASAIYNDLNYNLLELPYGQEQIEFKPTQKPNPIKIKVYSKADFNKFKTILKAKSDNAGVPMRLRSTNDTRISLDVPTEINRVLDLSSMNMYMFRQIIYPATSHAYIHSYIT